MANTPTRSALELGSLTRGEFDLMMFLYRHPHSFLTVQDLAVRVGHDQTQIESALHSLTRAGLVTARVVCSRGRSTYRVVIGTDSRSLDVVAQDLSTTGRRMRIRRLLRHTEMLYRSAFAARARARALIQNSATLRGVAGELRAKISSRLVDVRRLRGQLARSARIVVGNRP